MAGERPPANFIYVGLLALINVLLIIAGFFATSTFNRFETGLAEVVKGQDETRKEQLATRLELSETKAQIIGLRATMEAWKSQAYVPKEVYDQRKVETDRRIAMLEEAVKELRKG